MGEVWFSLVFEDCYRLSGRSLSRAGDLLVLLDKYRADPELKRLFQHGL